MKNITFIINGLIKKNSELIQNIRLVFSEDFNIEVKITQTHEDAIAFAKDSVIENTNYVIAVGGDGTLHEVINGILNCPKNKRDSTIVGILPIGSGNDFARTLRLQSDINFLKSLIINNEIKKIDIGKINLINMNGVKTTKYFVNIAEIGLGAEVVRKINAGRKILNPTLNFFLASVLAFLTYKKKKLKIASKSFNYYGDALVLCFANGRYFGSGLQIAPHARVNDGKLAVFLAGNVTLFDYLKNLSAIRRGSFIKHVNVQYSEIISCDVEDIDSGLFIEADGELIGKPPAHFEILKGELKFLA